VSRRSYRSLWPQQPDGDPPAVTTWERRPTRDRLQIATRALPEGHGTPGPELTHPPAEGGAWWANHNRVGAPARFTQVVGVRARQAYGGVFDVCLPQPVHLLEARWRWRCPGRRRSGPGLDIDQSSVAPGLRLRFAGVQGHQADSCCQSSVPGVGGLSLRRRQSFPRSANTFRLRGGTAANTFSAVLNIDRPSQLFEMVCCAVRNDKRTALKPYSIICVS
jgi:hypothetical protein